MTALELSRLQFALTITFHIIFPALSIGLASYLVVVEGRWLRTRKKVYYQSARFYSTLLALTFGMGVISGLAMAFQMGSNWSGFAKAVGPVLGILFTLESLTAFLVLVIGSASKYTIISRQRQRLLRACGRQLKVRLLF